MKAIVCRALSGIDDLRYEDVARRAVRNGEVRIRVHGAGINYPDTLKVRGLYQVHPTLPWIPGGEVAGVVSEVGEDVHGVLPGDRVLGVSDAQGGGFAQEIVLPAHRVLRIAKGMTFVEAAALPVVYGTALYALHQRGGLQAGEHLLVLGAAGGVGLAAVQLGKAMGAHVIAAASTEAKRKLALAHGADEVVDYTAPDWRHAVRDLTAGEGADVIFDPVGGDAFDEAVRCTAWMGRYLVIGFSSGRIPALRANHPLLKSYDLRGVRYELWRDRCWEQARANLEQVLLWHGEGRVRPHVSITYPLEQAVPAMQRMVARDVTGKIVLAPD